MSSTLMHRIELLRRRLSGDEEISVDDEWIPLAALNGTEENLRFFERPSSVRGAADGGLWIASYGGGEVLRLDANGSLVERYRGGLEGFDRPFDLLPLDEGRLLVSEFQADRISVVSTEGYARGYRIDSWGGTGRGKDAFLGPQFMALSEDGHYVYVSDWGNRRVTKWNLKGEFILTLGAGVSFTSFKGPAGIAVGGGRVYVADTLKGTVEVFDPDGNHLGTIKADTLESPEGLLFSDGDLLVADGRFIRRIDLRTGGIGIEADLGEGEHRITNLDRDVNGNLTLSDFNADRVILLTPLSTLYSGLNVTLDRLRSETHPVMAADVTVIDRAGLPIRGLDASNFIVVDGAPLIPEVNWRSSDDTSLSLAVLFDLGSTRQEFLSLSRGFRDLESALEDEDSLFLVTAGPEASLRAQDTAPKLMDDLSKETGEGPVVWDEALRLAATLLAPVRERKAVVALVASEPSQEAFDRYGLVETARFLANNGVLFYPVYADFTKRSRELDYLARETGGESLDLFRPSGTGALASALRRRPVGRYTLLWRSSTDAGFGRTFMPVAVEVMYFSKSGRDESAAFSPLR